MPLCSLSVPWQRDLRELNGQSSCLRTCREDLCELRISHQRDKWPENMMRVGYAIFYFFHFSPKNLARAKPRNGCGYCYTKQRQESHFQYHEEPHGTQGLTLQNRQKGGPTQPTREARTGLPIAERGHFPGRRRAPCSTFLKQ